jgi:hypothetical protein
MSNIRTSLQVGLKFIVGRILFTLVLVSDFCIKWRVITGQFNTHRHSLRHHYHYISHQ